MGETTAHPWKVKFTREFGLTLTPQIGIGAALNPIRKASFGLTLAPQIGVAAAGRSSAQFGLALTPQIGGDAKPRIPGSFGLTFTPTVGMAGVKAPVSFDATSDGGHGGTTTRSWTHTLAGNCIVVVLSNSTSTAATCTFGGVTIPRLFGPQVSGTVFPATSYTTVFALVSNSLPQGVQTVSCTQAATASAAGAVSFRNAGSLGTLITDTANGNVNKSTTPVAGAAAVCGYGGSSTNFGPVSPNEALRYSFVAFDRWTMMIGWGLDTGSGITFTSTQAISKGGAIVPILPAT